jgi:hypothetical protein
MNALRRLARRVGRRIGRRGAFLLFLAVLDLLYSFSLAHPPAESLRSPTVVFIGDVLPLEAWAALWASVGVVCLVGAFGRKDRWAFAAAMFLKVLWGGTFLAGWLIAGLDRGWVSAGIWLPMAVLVYIIATWAEPPVTVAIHTGGDEL